MRRYLPVLALLHLSSAPAQWATRLGQLGAAGVVLAAISLSWVLIYDLTPAADRPFVDSSPDNSMLELAVGHNALQRFIHPDPARRDAMLSAAAAAGAPVALSGRDFAPAGPLRLAAPRLAAQMGWLFPLALIGGIAAWRYARSGGESADVHHAPFRGYLRRSGAGVRYPCGPGPAPGRSTHRAYR